MSERQDRSVAILNQSCFCTTVDQDALQRALAAELGNDEDFLSVITARPHLFARVSVFVSAESVRRMREVVQAIETLASHPGYQETVLSWAPEIALYNPGPVGAFMGYDFHLEGDTPQLIEVNTNAGGAFFNAVLARAQTTCCPEAGQSGAKAAEAFEEKVMAMFRSEWRRQRGPQPLTSVAIIDDAPAAQYLYPEFLLAQHVFVRAGMEAVILDPKELSYDQGVLAASGRRIDLVYNRLTDFALSDPDHAHIRAAYRDGVVTITPNPRAHALFADKRNLTLFSNPALLSGWGIDEPTIETLRTAVPRTVRVTPKSAEELWKERRSFFFKPMSGFGSKGAYRGEKITKTVWQNIVDSGYVAQAFAAPGARTIQLNGAPTALKADIRLYTYAGRDLLMTARLYQGQTTNMRTAGGGFAPVFVTDEKLR